MSPPADDKSTGDDELAPLVAMGEALDLSTFGQILEMDDPPDHEFSASIVFDFFDQAEETFTKMDAALDESDLPTLSDLGHFLKGSSATLGMNKVRDGCEKIQQYGKRIGDDGTHDLDRDFCLEQIKDAISHVKHDYAEVEAAFRDYYGQFE